MLGQFQDNLISIINRKESIATLQMFPCKITKPMDKNRIEPKTSETRFPSDIGARLRPPDDNIV